MLFALTAWIVVAAIAFYAMADEEAGFRSAIFGFALLGLVLLGIFAGMRARGNRESAMNSHRTATSDDPHGDIMLIFCGLIFCEVCRCEFTCASEHPQFSDEAYHEKAAAMREQGWTVGADGITAYCPTCSTPVSTTRASRGGTQ